MPNEVVFWKGYIETGGLRWPDEFLGRKDPEAPLTERLIIDALRRILHDPVEILDVGSGPLTSLGKKYAGRDLAITATDPLADEYSTLLSDAGIEAPVKSVAVLGEALHDEFGSARFDIAYARNAVDHVVNPIRVVREMVAVVRPGGFVLLRHWEDEAKFMSYRQLHQWNLTVDDGRAILWGRRTRIDIQEAVGETARVTAAFDDSDFAQEGRRWVTIVCEVS